MEDSFCIQFVLLNVFLKTSAIVVQSMKFFFFLGNGKLFSSLGKSYLLCRKVIMQKGYHAERFSENTESWMHLLEDVQPVFVISKYVCKFTV